MKLIGGYKKEVHGLRTKQQDAKQKATTLYNVLI